MKKELLFVSAVFASALFAASETVVLQNGLEGYSSATDRACVDDYGAFGSGMQKTQWWLSEDIAYGNDYSSPSSEYFSVGYFECWGDVNTLHEVRANIEFDLSSTLPTESVIESATLSVYRLHEPKVNMQYGYDQDGTLYCYESTKSWSSDVTNWKQLFGTIANAYDKSNGVEINYTKNTIGWIEFDVTDIVAKHASDASANHGFHLGAYVSQFAVDGNSGINGGYASSEYAADVSLRPKLTITYSGDGEVTPRLTLSPLSQTSFVEGEDVSIDWSGTVTGDISVSLLKDGNKIADIETVSFGDKGYIWRVGSEEPANGYAIAISSASAGISDTTELFSIEEKQVTIDLTLLERENYALEGVSSSYDNNGTYSGDKAIDSDLNSCWFSDGSATLPASITFSLNELFTLTGFAVLPRQDGKTTALIKEYRFEISTDGSSWTEVASGSWSSGGSEKVIALADSVSAKYVRFSALSTIGGENYVGIADFNLYYDANSVAVLNQVERVGVMTIGGISNEGLLSLSVQTSGQYRCTLHSLDGRVLEKREMTLTSGVNHVPVTSSLSQRVVILTVEGAAMRQVEKLFIE